MTIAPLLHSILIGSILTRAGGGLLYGADSLAELEADIDDDSTSSLISSTSKRLLSFSSVAAWFTCG